MKNTQTQEQKKTKLREWKAKIKRKNNRDSELGEKSEEKTKAMVNQLNAVLETEPFAFNRNGQISREIVSLEHVNESFIQTKVQEMWKSLSFDEIFFDE